MENKILTKEEMNNLVGGITTAELIAIAWENTPEGGSSHWENNGDGCWTWSRSDLPVSSPFTWCF